MQVSSRDFRAWHFQHDFHLEMPFQHDFTEKIGKISLFKLQIWLTPVNDLMQARQQIPGCNGNTSKFHVHFSKESTV